MGMCQAHGWRAATTTAVAVSATLLVGVGVAAQDGGGAVAELVRRAQARPVRADGLDILRLRPNFHVIAGAGANIGILTGPDGLIVVDSGRADRAEAVVAAIAELSPEPIRYVINTSADADHVGGNEIVAQTGQTILNLNNAVLSGLTNDGAAAVLASENVLLRMSAPTGEVSPFPPSMWPTETFAGPRSYMYLNDEGIETLHLPAAHTDGDSVVFFRRTDVVMAGDILDATRFPHIDLARGGSVQGEIAALQRLVELAIPAFPLVWREGGTYVVPGHGRVYAQFDVVEYRDMVMIIRDRVQALIDGGATLGEVQAVRPARGYTAQYGADDGPWTTAMFVEAVYRSLEQEAAQ